MLASVAARVCDQEKAVCPGGNLSMPSFRVASHEKAVCPLGTAADPHVGMATVFGSAVASRVALACSARGKASG